MIDFHLEWERNIHQQPPRFTSFTRFGLIVPERTSHIVRLDEKTGQAIWDVRIKNPWGWMAVTDTCVVYLNQHQFLQCFNIETGEPFWEQDLPDPYNGNLVAKNRFLILGGWRGYSNVTCIDIASGKTNWIYPKVQSYGKPILGANGIFLSSITGKELKNLQLIDYEHGNLKFEINIPKGVPAWDRSIGIKLIRNTLYAFTWYGEIYYLNEGQQRWIFKGRRQWIRQTIHFQGIKTLTPTVLEDCVLFLDLEKQLCCYNLGDWKLHWTYHLEHNLVEFLPAIRYESMLIIGTSEGQLIVLDESGNRVSTQNIGKRILTHLFLTEEEKLILGTKGKIKSFSLMTGNNTPIG